MFWCQVEWITINRWNSLIFRKSLEISYKCRPANLRTKVACNGESLNLRCTKPWKLAIAIAKVSFTQTDIRFCQIVFDGAFERICEEFSVSFYIKSLCQGREECNIIAESSKLSILSNNKSVEDKIACSKNLSVLRVTSACVDERILRPEFLFKPSSMTEKERIPLIETIDVRRVSINSSTNTNLVEIIEAKPPEPKKSVITFHQNEVKAQDEDHYEVRIKF